MEINANKSAENTGNTDIVSLHFAPTKPSKKIPIILTFGTLDLAPPPLAAVRHTLVIKMWPYALNNIRHSAMLKSL